MIIAQKVPIDCLVHAPCIELNYYDQGSGEPLVFIHGLGGNADSWRPQIEALANHCRVLAMDLRGHGQSGWRMDEPITIRAFAEDAIALIDSLGIDKAHLCGHSMGGMIALEIFVRRPHKIKSLILADTSAFFPPPQTRGELLEHFDRLELPVWSSLMASRVLRRGASQEQQQEVAQMLAATPRALYRQGLLATFDGDYRWVLPLIDLPTLILVGEEDRATPIGYARYLQVNIRDSLLQEIPLAGHFSNLENPAAFNWQILSHIKRFQVEGDPGNEILGSGTMPRRRGGTPG